MNYFTQLKGHYCLQTDLHISHPYFFSPILAPKIKVNISNSKKLNGKW